MTEPEPVSQPLHPGVAAIERLADATGILQHSRLSIPDPDHGYCLDDNARALILIHRRRDLADAIHDRWARVFANFVARAWNPERQCFRNLMSFDGAWLEDEGSEDSWGRALWSLGVTATEARSPADRAWALALFDEASGNMLGIGSPRAMAFCVLGAAAVLGLDASHERAVQIATRFAERLSELAQAEARPNWRWFERVLAYDNCRLPEALLRAGRSLDRGDLTALGLATLGWIPELQTAPEGHFRAVGSESFGREYCRPSLHDQQPLEAQGMIEVCGAAYAATNDPIWLDRAERAYAWFHGANDGRVALADHASGECYDGLTPCGVNFNRGAESVLAFQLASCAITRMRGEGRAP